MSDTIAPIDVWLADRHARRLWSASTGTTVRGSRTATITGYAIAGTLVIVTRYPDGGWDLFTSCPSLSIADSLADADARLSGAAV